MLPNTVEQQHTLNATIRNEVRHLPRGLQQDIDRALEVSPPPRARYAGWSVGRFRGASVSASPDPISSSPASLLVAWCVGLGWDAMHRCD